MEDSSERTFSPLQGSIPTMIFTFAYLSLLFLALSYLRWIAHDPYNLTGFRFENIDIESLLLISLLLILSIILTSVIHRSLFAGVLSASILVGVFLLTLHFLPISSEGRGYIVLGLIHLYTPHVIGLSALSICLRPFLRMKFSLLKCCILVAPFVTILVVSGFLSLNAANPSLYDCPRVASLSGMESCFERIARRGNDPKVCEAIPNALDKGICVAAFAIQNKDLSLCERYLNPGSDRHGCFWEYELKQKDALACSSVDRVEDRDECYYGIAFAAKHPAFCEQIHDEGQQRECVQASLS